MSMASDGTAEYASIGKVLQEAMQEICCLEDKNTKMQDALNELHNNLAGATYTVSEKQSDDKNAADMEQLRAENKHLLEQLNEFKKASSDLTSKLTNLSSTNLDFGAEKSDNCSLVELKKRLSTSSILCQKLAANKNDNVTTRKSKQDSEINISSDSILDQSNADELQRRLCDALEKNVRWQNYNAEREQYVSLLLSKYNQNCVELQSVRQKLAEITSNPNKLPLEQRRHFDKLLVDARQELENQRSQTLRVNTELTILKDKHKEEVGLLEKNVERWRQRYEEQRENLARLNANYEHERRRSNNNAVESKEKQSQIQLLHRQVQLFSEDFRAERKEKEIAENEVQFLREKVNQLQLQLDKYNKKSRISDIIYDELHGINKYIAPEVPAEEGKKKVRKRATSPPKQVTRKTETPRSDATDELSGRSSVEPRRRPPPIPKARSRLAEVKKDSKATLRSRASPRVDSPTGNNKKSFKPISESSAKKVSRKRMSDTDSLLQCPTCGRQYDINEHILLLEHIDICGD